MKKLYIPWHEKHFKCWRSLRGTGLGKDIWGLMKTAKIIEGSKWTQELIVWLNEKRSFIVSVCLYDKEMPFPKGPGVLALKLLSSPETFARTPSVFAPLGRGHWERCGDCWCVQVTSRRHVHAQGWRRHFFTLKSDYTLWPVRTVLGFLWASVSKIKV